MLSVFLTVFSVRFLQLHIVHFFSKSHLKSHPSLKILNQYNLCEVIPELNVSFLFDTTVLFYTCRPCASEKKLVPEAHVFLCIVSVCPAVY